MKKDLKKALIDLKFLEDVEEIITPGSAGAIVCCVLGQHGGAAFCC
ncbi:MAG: hypothetical protein LBF82_01975 [Lactobacillales bacterium]|jgi:hypothetical protein|nr:hypothetical protein [Lactobacillales bacterium]